MAYDRGRLDQLRVGLTSALDDLQAMRCDDPEAAGALRAIRQACRIIGDRCLPRVRDLLSTDPMAAPTGSSAASCQFRASPFFELTHDLDWELADDPLDLNGDPLRLPLPYTDATKPWNRSYDEVMSAIECGDLVPLSIPSDPHRPRADQITRIDIAPAAMSMISATNVTGNFAKIVDVLSDVSPFGYRDHTDKYVYYVNSAVVTTTVRVFDPDTHEQFPPQISRAVVSGYLVVRDHTLRTELNISANVGDPTANISIPLETDHGYRGAFYPDSPVELTPAAEPPSDSDPSWTFLQSDQPVIAETFGNWGRV